ncbi:MAG: hypothetical protein M3R38_16875 [Actinomycetota bacterium]|nr:hypothetical protein [Actinomycetota bacterium]
MPRIVVRKKCGLLDTVLWSALVLDLAVLALIVGPLGAFSGGDPVETARSGAVPAEGPADGRAAAATADAPQRQQQRTGPPPGAEGYPAPTVPEGPRPGDAPLLCAPQEALVYSWRERVAVAADRAGHFTLYGGADPESGRPMDDSYDLLRDCSPELSFANSTTLRVDGGEPELAGAENNVVRTRKAERDGALTSVYRFGGGIAMTQSLRLVDEKGPGGPALEISYRLANRSPQVKTVGLRSLLNPPIWAAAPDRPAYQAPVLAERSVGEGGRKNGRIVTERTMLGEEARAPFYVPRKGAASDSSGRWEPGAEGPPPERVTFAGSLRFLRSPFFYEARPGYVLPPNSAFAAYWTDLSVEAGQEVTVSHRYVADPSPSPPSEVDGAPSQTEDEKGPRDSR